MCGGSHFDVFSDQNVHIVDYKTSSSKQAIRLVNTLHAKFVDIRNRQCSRLVGL